MQLAQALGERAIDWTLLALDPVAPEKGQAVPLFVLDDLERGHARTDGSQQRDLLLDARFDRAYSKHAGAVCELVGGAEVLAEQRLNCEPSRR
jgi:hypothetical protein